MLRWMLRALMVFLVVVVGAVLWFLWPVIRADAPSVKPPRGVQALAAPLKPGCSVNAELRIDLRGEGRMLASGKPAAASLVVARDRCMDLDRPLVAFNWFTLRDVPSTILMYRYQLFAAQKVAHVAMATALVFRGSGPTIVSTPPQAGPTRGREWNQPWVHQGMTMPFYPSAKAILHMVDASRDRYFDEIDIKRRAIGEDGYFGFQECLVNCERLVKSSYDGLRALFTPQLQPPVLILHAAVSRSAAEVFLAEVKGRSDLTIGYAGWTVADVLSEGDDGAREPFLQKPLWQDLTVIFVPAPGTATSDLAGILVADAAYRNLTSSATSVALVQY